MTTTKELYIDNLVIEVTRKCNMCCDHCLRGEAQDDELNMLAVYELFSQIDHVYSITLTGGEPSLAVNEMRWIREAAYAHNVEIENFYIATNGKDVPDEFVQEIVRWYGQCTSNEITQVKVSNDNYHEYGTEYNDMLKLLKIVTFEEYEYFDEYLVAQGNAIDYTRASRILEPEVFDVDENDDCINVIEGTLYMNVHGDIIGGCDWSYEEQENQKIGNVLGIDLRTWARSVMND